MLGQVVHSWVDLKPRPSEERIAAIFVECALDVVRERRIAAALVQAEYPTMAMAVRTMKRMLLATDHMSAVIDEIQLANSPEVSTLENLQRARREAEKLLDEMTTGTRNQSS